MKRKSERKVANRICSYLLTAAMVVTGLTLSPITTVEVQAAATTQNVNLNVSNSIAGLVTNSGYSGNSTIYYASQSGIAYPWKIVAAPSEKLTLFSTGFIGGTHKYEPFTDHNPAGNWKHNDWSGSDICAYLNGKKDGVSGIDHESDGIFCTRYSDGRSRI